MSGPRPARGRPTPPPPPAEGATQSRPAPEPPAPERATRATAAASPGQSRAAELAVARTPSDEASLAAATDAYFHRTKKLLEAEGGGEVTYAVFLRRPILAAHGIALSWLRRMAEARGFPLSLEMRYAEGDWVGAGEPLFYYGGPFAELVDLETVLLQKLGPPCVAAYNAFRIASALPRTAFIAMDARHNADPAMSEAMAYAAAVGSARAQAEAGAVGFVASSTSAGAAAFGQTQGAGTMPHAWVGHCGSTLEAALRFDRMWPNEPLTVLVDYFAREITDSLAVAAAMPERAAAGTLSVRLDVPGSRYLEGLSPETSYEVLERRAPAAIRRYLTEEQQRYLLGPGVSAAAVWRLREALDEAGWRKVKITASSGFNAEKCESLALAEVPLDAVGTGSFLPERWSETYATADIVRYGKAERVKVGREFLLPSRNRGPRDG